MIQTDKRNGLWYWRNETRIEIEQTRLEFLMDCMLKLCCLKIHLGVSID